MTKVITALTALAMIVLLSGASKCDDTPKNNGDSGHVDPVPNANPAPHNQPHPEAPPGLQHPNPIQGDPDPHPTDHDIRLALIWQGEHSGQIEYTVGGAAQRIAAPRSVKGEGGKYYGRWDKQFIAAPGSVVGFTWFPNFDGMWAMCTLYNEGGIQDYQIVQSGACAVSWKVPA